MKIPVKLQELLQQPEAAILSISSLIGQKLALVDCTNIASVTSEQLNLIFTHIPQEWDYRELTEIFDTNTLTDTFINQLYQYIDQRLGRTPTQQTTTSPLSTPDSLDIFNFRNEIIGDYRRYIESFLKIRDTRVEEFVNQELEKGQLWTNPLVQLNPKYRPGATVNELVKNGILHPDCIQYFSKNGNPFHFHFHQKQAFETAQKQEPYVLTTGTGSGKSMTYVVPIFDDLLRHPDIQGVRAILVYPMNALINSQEEELKKFLNNVPNSHIRVAKYTGQESLTIKTEIQNNPPHILLTNYVMLELMLSRTQEEKLVASPELKFLVLDELHTYRGRQGADVAILIRKLRQRCGQNLLCIGTSATMSTEGTRTQRRQVVADVASKLFGVEIKPDNVIDETLERSIKRPEPTITELQESIDKGLPPEAEQTLENFQNHPLSYWIEMTFGLEDKQGHLVRRTPITLEAGAEALANQTQLPPETCLNVLKQMFLWGSKVKGLAFRLHQFISQGGSVYSTIETPAQRFLTLEGQYTTTEERLLYPLVFCRECGHDYYVVNYNNDKQIVLPQLPTALDISPEYADIQAGYLTLDEPGLWDAYKDEERLPDSWFTETKKKGRVPKKDYAKFIPQKLQILPNGKVTTSPLQGTTCWFVPRPFRVCLNCGVVHDGNKNEFTKLSRLSSEGRSTATTLLCLSTVSRLKQVFTGEKAQAAKILSFTDNRQDASLQAGHFNDFVQTSFLRAALLGALQSKGQLTHSELVSEVIKQMGLTQAEYAKEVAEFGRGKQRNEDAFRKLIEYRLYEDLRRGWRIVQPNLEQCGLLVIQYDGLQDICAEPALWQKHRHPVLLQASPQERFIAAQALLNHLRRELAVDAKLLQPDQRDSLIREVFQAIKEPWVFDENEQLHQATWATIASGTNEKAKVKLTTKSKIGRFLRSPKAWSLRSEVLTEVEYSNLITTFVNALADAGYLYQDKAGIQLRIDALVWKATKLSEIPPDPLTSKRLQGQEDAKIPVNSFFQEFYQNNARKIQTMEGREHTGQVRTQARQEREERFRKGELASLFCSPTMELGIDISDLSVVHLRNVPPSPANYAQRSGRAGRSGQEALVITYAAIGSGHDQYFFQRQQQMVAGAVAPPKLELANQDLVQSHVYSIWLAHTGVYLNDSMNQVLDLDVVDYPLKESIRQQLILSPAKLAECLQATQSILADTFCQSDLQKASWYSVHWLQFTLENALNTFDRKCDRWRELFREAVMQLSKARDIIDRHARGCATQEENDTAKAQEREALRQRSLLVGLNQGKSNSEFEFYPYRYFAAEGFLPGFNFPRLPVRAFIPTNDGGEFISRPRVVALREFAPSNIIYYEGSKFMVSKTKVPVGGIDSQYKRVTVCFNCGYFHEGNFRDTCENCGAQIKGDTYQNIAKLNRVLSMDTALTRRRERITCDEEERLKYGYNITTHFRYALQKQESATVLAADNTPLFKLTYGATATIWRINRGLKKNTEERGFKLDTKTGIWGDAKNNVPSDSLHTEVNLMVDDTCNILVIEPLEVPQDNKEAFIATLQYTLETAIQAVYKLEPDELDSERLGEGKYLLFWEASEGGAGVLSQLLQQADAFVKIANAALDICHFLEPKDTCVQACYECLLSYRNQFDHPLINRHLIKPLLDELQGSAVEISGVFRDEQYQKLLSQTDPNSDFERAVLQEIYQRGYKLPDAAQELIPEANCKPDFVYKEEAIALFCDGSVHDSPEQKRQDQIERDNLRYNASYQILTLRHDEDWREKLEILGSL
ncbi:DEAD/DEAH box helicase [Anabaena sp. 4-3]|uniref:DEAD/DEAH box helicase n=1 Tax=Anabaena sp. 4-3 TaxID=1811979 RepID=UPI00082DC865|nr:DEAD/DEAH box helicase [Anabaena sp. 4-3]